ncbi:phospholipase/carboxylesterase family protein [Stachybotrys elegans]|uniref:Phospholipase/carboxylesterase family protein n=1 Tax=Stachybotrys elegans TaxID=80388 RepID=A0A8K0WKL8_9HYPO|nr:phospholipase/carboxylesterase family protein [Stachybotrys elegans]
MASPPAPIIVQPTAPQTHTVVFLHGRGDNVNSFVQSLRYFQDSHDRSLGQRFPSFRWVFPEAPTARPVSCPGQQWPQWFDIWNTADFSLREELQAEGLRSSVDRIRQLLAQEAALLGGRWDRIILAGISQGAATSVHTLLNLDIPQPGGGLAAFMGFSCRMPFPGRSLQDTRKVLQLDNVPEHADVLRNTPILLEHCVDDPLVLIDNGRGLRDSLRGFGAQVEWKEYPSGGHWFNSPAGMDDVAAFLGRVLSAQQ